MQLHPNKLVIMNYIIELYIWIVSTNKFWLYRLWKEKAFRRCSQIRQSRQHVQYEEKKATKNATEAISYC